MYRFNQRFKEFDWNTCTKMRAQYIYISFEKKNYSLTFSATQANLNQLPFFPFMTLCAFVVQWLVLYTCSERCRYYNTNDKQNLSITMLHKPFHFA